MISLTVSWGNVRSMLEVEGLEGWSRMYPIHRSDGIGARLPKAP